MLTPEEVITDYPPKIHSSIELEDKVSFVRTILVTTGRPGVVFTIIY